MDKLTSSVWIAISSSILFLLFVILSFLWYKEYKNQTGCSKRIGIAKCPCGSDSIVMMKCAECNQPAKGCSLCLRRLSPCTLCRRLRNSTRNFPLAVPREFGSIGYDSYTTMCYEDLIKQQIKLQINPYQCSMVSTQNDESDESGKSHFTPNAETYSISYHTEPQHDRVESLRERSTQYNASECIPQESKKPEISLEQKADLCQILEKLTQNLEAMRPQNGSVEACPETVPETSPNFPKLLPDMAPETVATMSSYKISNTATVDVSSADLQSEHRVWLSRFQRYKSYKNVQSAKERESKQCMIQQRQREREDFPFIQSDISVCDRELQRAKRKFARAKESKCDQPFKYSPYSPGIYASMHAEIQKVANSWTDETNVNTQITDKVETVESVNYYADLLKRQKHFNDDMFTQ